MKNILSTMAVAMMLASCNVVGANNSTASDALDAAARKKKCGDPKLATMYVTTFDVPRTTHTIQPRHNLITADMPTNGAGEWTWQGDSFRAWETPQPSTVPLYLFFNPTTTDYSFILSTNGVAPAPAGQESQGIRAYVYPTKKCGSVPLYALSQPSVGDHWYTTSTMERDAVLKGGWTDLGILAYVLPISDGSCTCDS